ncbi:MAG: sugar phosphate isomerase/epimerase family protein [Verrucomicrobiota bacterium]|nr:sugar phosphate isomerase/epimerase family protein [Verrucomicrobiota bacterium]
MVPPERLAVCSWSLQPASPEELFECIGHTGIRRIQLALDPIRENPAVWGRTIDEARRRGFELVSGMFGTMGEDYTTMESIKATGGIVPDHTWQGNWKNIQQIARIAADHGISLVTFHSGFLPHDESDPSFKKILERIAQIADLFHAHQLELGFETGQEDAPTLHAFLTKLNRPNVGVNFDPANMILYDKGDPIEALKILAPFLKQCHVKDAIRTNIPGSWGNEVPVGKGEVDWKSFFNTLQQVGFQGNCCIEREAGNQRIEDIKTAHSYLVNL